MAATLDLEAELQIAGTVQPYARHVFLCYEVPGAWPDDIEDAETDSLPGRLSAAIKARQPDLNKTIRFTVCERNNNGSDDHRLSTGDVLIFPDMIQYKGLTCSNADSFVEQVLVRDGVWLRGPRRTMSGFYVFVCCHEGEKKRCHIIGPLLIEKFRKEVEAQGLVSQVVTVSACSHIGGNKYAGNIIIFGPESAGQVAGGHWYGWVLPCVVRYLLHRHVGRRQIMDELELWRGQMGLSKEQQKEAFKLRKTEREALKLRNVMENACSSSDQTSSGENVVGGSKKAHAIMWQKLVSGFKTRERACCAALAVASAAVVVFVAARVYKNLN